MDLIKMLESMPDTAKVSINAIDLKNAGMVDSEYVTLDGVPDYRPVTVTVGMIRTAAGKPTKKTKKPPAPAATDEAKEETEKEKPEDE